MFAESGLDIWHWSNPIAATTEIKQAGFEVLAYGGMEGLAGGMAALIEKFAAEHPGAFENLVQAAVESSELPQYRDATDHLHFVVTRN